MTRISGRVQGPDNPDPWILDVCLEMLDLASTDDRKHVQRLLHHVRDLDALCAELLRDLERSVHLALVRNALPVRSQSGRDEVRPQEGCVRRISFDSQTRGQDVHVIFRASHRKPRCF